jgi:hypothetical protein
MKERWNRIRTGVLCVVLVAAGVWEYFELMHSFDIPQVILIMPIVGVVSFILLRKKVFIVPAGTIVLSFLFQISSGKENAVAYLQTGASSVLKIILYVLPVCILFELIGIGAGALICVLFNKKQKLAVGIVCLLLGLVLVFAPYLALYHNPLYPIQARIELKNRVDDTYSDYAIHDKRIYFDLNSSSYRCRVIMADGVVREVE